MLWCMRTTLTLAKDVAAALAIEHGLIHCSTDGDFGELRRVALGESAGWGLIADNGFSS